MLSYSQNVVLEIVGHFLVAELFIQVPWVAAFAGVRRRERDLASLERRLLHSWLGFGKEEP